VRTDVEVGRNLMTTIETDDKASPTANDLSDVSIAGIMATDVVTVEENDSIEDVVELFEKHHLHTYPVVTADGELAGLIDQDIVLEILLFERIPRSKHTHLAAVRVLGEDARGIMRPYPVTISSDTDLCDAADLMMKHHINRVCVVDNRKLVGVISKRDIINEVYRRRR